MNTHKNTISPFKPYLQGTGGYEGGPSMESVQTSGKKVYKLSSNENPLGASPKALEALRLHLDNLHVYPDNTPVHLQKALSAYYRGGLKPEQFIVANSGSEVLELTLRAFLGEGTEYIYSTPCFSPYSMFSNWQGARGVNVPLDPSDFSLDVEGIVDAITEHTRILFLTSPNNPTGTHIPRETLDGLLSQLPRHVIVVWDEVYFHFADAPDYTTALPYVQAGYPVIAVNSFSKTYGLAGLRLGYGYSTPEIAAYVRQLCRPFLVNALALSAGIAALEDREFVGETVACVHRERAILHKALDALPLTYWPTQANFVLIKPEIAAEVLQQKLQERGIMVREMESFGAPGCLRVTVGNAEANRALIQALMQIFL